MQVIQRSATPRCSRALEPRVGIDLTLHEEIALEFGTITRRLTRSSSGWSRTSTVRPGFAELAARRPLILSAGFHELIEPVLERGESSSTCSRTMSTRTPGWLAGPLPRRAPLRDLRRAVQAGRLRRAAVCLRRRRLSDRCAALAADRVFARDGLARHLDDVGVPYEPFEDLRRGRDPPSRYPGHRLITIR